MPAIGKSAFLAPLAPVITPVAMPECGFEAYVCVRELSARDLVDLRERQGETGDTANIAFVYDLLARTLCNDSGSRLFTDAADCEASFGLPVKTLERLAGEVLKTSGLQVTEKN